MEPSKEIPADLVSLLMETMLRLRRSTYGEGSDHDRFPVSLRLDERTLFQWRALCQRFHHSDALNLATAILHAAHFDESAPEERAKADLIILSFTPQKAEEHRYGVFRVRKDLYGEAARMATDLRPLYPNKSVMIRTAIKMLYHLVQFMPQEKHTETEDTSGERKRRPHHWRRSSVLRWYRRKNP